MRTSKFRQVRAARLADPRFQAEVARERALMAEIDLAIARRVSGMTQHAVADRMGSTQENVSRIEHQQDLLVSTLAEFIGAQGGSLEISAVFGEERVPLLRSGAPKP